MTYRPYPRADRALRQVQRFGSWLGKVATDIRDGFDTITLGRPSGGAMRAWQPKADEVPVVLSPGSYPPEFERYYTREQLAAINKGRRP
jgi:hypothetical protein